MTGQNLICLKTQRVIEEYAPLAQMIHAVFKTPCHVIIGDDVQADAAAKELAIGQFIIFFFERVVSKASIEIKRYVTFKR